MGHRHVSQGDFSLHADDTETEMLVDTSLGQQVLKGMGEIVEVETKGTDTGLGLEPLPANNEEYFRLLATFSSQDVNGGLAVIERIVDRMDSVAPFAVPRIALVLKFMENHLNSLFEEKENVLRLCLRLQNVLWQRLDDDNWLHAQILENSMANSAHIMTLLPVQGTSTEEFRKHFCST